MIEMSAGLAAWKKERATEESRGGGKALLKPEEDQVVLGGIRNFVSSK